MTNFSNFVSVELKDSKQEQPKKHKIACKNCARLHHKCDKISPSCSHCLKKGVKCEVNDTKKKRGRPFGTTKENLEMKKINKRTLSNPTVEIPETKRVKILKPQREMEVIRQIPAQNDNQFYFQVPIDINWEFNFQDIKREEESRNMMIIPTQNIVSNEEIYGTNNVTYIQPNFSHPPSQYFSNNCTDFSVSSPPSEESTCDDFVLNVENLDFDNFNSFLVDQDIQFF